MTPKSMLWRGAILALMAAVLTLTLSAQPRARDDDPAQARAQAQPQQGEDCKDSLNAAGRSKFRPFTRSREIAGKGAAMADAVANWQRDVITKYGRQYMLWDKAGESSFYCGPANPGPIGSLFIGCTVQARPCNAADPQDPDPAGEDPQHETCEEYPRRIILEAQRRMNGCDACGREIAVDGACGQQTRRCIRTFQGSRFGREQGLETNGMPDRKTMRALRQYCDRN
jgi:hypothetical protein